MLEHRTACINSSKASGSLTENYRYRVIVDEWAANKISIMADFPFTNRWGYSLRWPFSVIWDI